MVSSGLDGIIDEIWTNLRKEINFRQEAQNIRRIALAFVDWSTIHIPGVIDGLVSESIIVQERSGGRRIDDPAIKPDGPGLRALWFTFRLVRGSLDQASFDTWPAWPD